jgi:hypothetical protein
MLSLSIGTATASESVLDSMSVEAILSVMGSRQRRFLLLTLLLAASGYSQQRWERVFGGRFIDRAYSVQQTSDSGYIVAGYTRPDGAERYSMYLIKTDSSGDTLWTRTYGGSQDAYARSARQTSDGGFIAAGYVLSPPVGKSDVYLVRTTASGDTLWTRTYGGTDDDWGNAVQQTSDNGFIITGATGSTVPSGGDIYLVKTNATGDTLWSRRFGAGGPDEGWSVLQTADGGYVLAGYTCSPGAGLTDFCLIRTSVSGSTRWTRTYGDTNWDFGYSVSRTSDGGFILAGETYPSGGDSGSAVLIRTDSMGDTLWTRSYGASYGDCGRSVQQTSDGGFIMAGLTSSSGAGGGDVCLVKTNSSGETTWTRTYGGVARDGANSVQQTWDRGYIVAGWTESFGAGGGDVYVLKTDSMGNAAVTEAHPSSPLRHPQLAISAIPSLFRQATTLTCFLPAGAPAVRLEVWNTAGRPVRVFAAQRPASSAPLSFIWTGIDDRGCDLPSGCYFCTLRAGGKEVRTKVLLSR